jgi:hypothetical protein
VIHFRKGFVAENLGLGVHVLLGGLPQPEQVNVDALAEDVVDHLRRLLGDGGVEQPQAFLLKICEHAGGERALHGPVCVYICNTECYPASFIVELGLAHGLDP